MRRTALRILCLAAAALGGAAAHGADRNRLEFSCLLRDPAGGTRSLSLALDEARRRVLLFGDATALHTEAYGPVAVRWSSSDFRAGVSIVRRARLSLDDWQVIVDERRRSAADAGVREDRFEGVCELVSRLS